jgi:hypothetical protein
MMLLAVAAAVKKQGFDVELGQYVPISGNQVQTFNLKPV